MQRGVRAREQRDRQVHYIGACARTRRAIDKCDDKYKREPRELTGFKSLLSVRGELADVVRIVVVAACSRTGSEPRRYG